MTVFLDSSLSFCPRLTPNLWTPDSGSAVRGYKNKLGPLGITIKYAFRGKQCKLLNNKLGKKAEEYSMTNETLNIDQGMTKWNI